MARDRKRAKQRRARSAGASGSAAQKSDANNGELERADVPGALDHASADVDEFDAAIVRGAGGVPVDPGEAADEAIAEENALANSPERLSEGEIEAEAEAEGQVTADELQELTSGPQGVAAVTPERVSGAPIRSGNRVIGFLRASWAELQRVQWPDRRAVSQATAVVIGFVAIAGLYLGLADYVAKELVEFIL